MNTIIRKHVRTFHTSLNRFGVIKPFLLADIGEGITDCEVVQWFVKPGDIVNEFDKVCEVQSDKASVEISSRYSGKIVAIHYKQNDVAKVGQPLVDIETEEEEQDNHTNIVNEQVNQTSVVNDKKAVGYQTSWELPSVRRLLNEYGLKVNDVNGSGKGGLVLKHDILRHIQTQNLVNNNEVMPTKSTVELPVKNVVELPVNTGDYTVPLNPIQKAMFKAMTQSLSIPQLGYKDEIELDDASKYRQSLNDYIQHQPNSFPFKKMSYLPIFIKSMSLSLTRYPILNAQLIQAEDGSTKIKYRDYHHIGVAMDTPQGLLVPNIKNVEKKTIFDIALEMHRLTELAKKGSLSPADLKGGTITMSNIGTIGGTYANPVLVSNELAIVALGSAKRLPRFDLKSNQLVAKHILPVSWSADHRIIDGATIAQFGNTWKQYIENPLLLTSELR